MGGGGGWLLIRVLFCECCPAAAGWLVVVTAGGCWGLARGDGDGAFWAFKLSIYCWGSGGAGWWNLWAESRVSHFVIFIGGLG